MKSDQELRELAVEIVEGRVFTSWQVPPIEVPSAFFALRLIPPETMERWSTDPATAPAVLYESMEKAGLLECNGHPMFMSFSFLLEGDANRLREFVTAYRESRKEFVRGA